MIQFPEDFDSVFRYVEVVSQRAQQIISGAKPRADSRATKPTLQARDDVDAGAVQWRVLTQEELDAQRQAMVEQFRAEMGGDERGSEADEVRDVLPTVAAAAAAAVEVEDEERDDELLRLQQLLGLMGGKPAAAESDTAESAEAEAEDTDAMDAETEPLDLEDEDRDDADEED